MGFALLVNQPDADERLLGEAQRMQRTMDRDAHELRSACAEQLRSLLALGPADWMKARADDREKEGQRDGVAFLAL
ncbi:MAG TPA: hypothetical protein VKG92_05575, partial [Flavobacteriales bacterium]|nr:hypothetical protein [Flavobacteriales bacterium]